MNALSSTLIQSSDSLTGQRNRFIELATRYSEFAKKAGVELVPYRDASLPNFSRCSLSERHRILLALAQRVTICDIAEANGDSMSSTPALTWAALRCLNLRPPSDLFNYIGNDSIVEMHTPDGFAVFQTFGYYRLCSYSLEEISSIHWSELHTRPEWVTPMVFEMLTMVFTGQVTGVTRPDIPPHVLSETRSPLKYSIDLDIEWVAPLYTQGESNELPSTSLVIDRARLAGVNATGPETFARPEKPGPALTPLS